MFQATKSAVIFFFFFTAASVNLDTWQGQTQVYRGPHQLPVMAQGLQQEAVLWSRLCGPLPSASPDSLIFIVPHPPFSLLESFSPPGGRNSKWQDFEELTGRTPGSVNQLQKHLC